MDYRKIIENEYYVNPTLTCYGTLPIFLEKQIANIRLIKPYSGGRPNWLPSTEKVRGYLMKKYWGANYQSRSLNWIIGHNGSPLSEDSIHIDHIVKWEEISEKLLYQYCGRKAKGTRFEHLTVLPHDDGKLIKGIDYIDDPDVLEHFGEDVLYRFTNVAAIKYFHTIENLRPLPGSVNGRRNNGKLTDKDLSIVHPLNIDFELMKKLAELSASMEEYITQVVHLTETYEDDEREIHVQMFIEKTSELISSLSDVNRSEFI